MPDLSYAFLTSLTDGQLPDLDEKEFFLDSFLKFSLISNEISQFCKFFFIKTRIGIVSTY